MPSHVVKSRDEQIAHMINHTHVDERGCWLWDRSCTTSGYAQLRYGGIGFVGHVLMYMLWFDTLPGELDHEVCDTKTCINPYHVVPTTRRDNIRRAAGWTKRDGVWYCKFGHRMDGYNADDRGKQGVRCRACARK